MIAHAGGWQLALGALAPYTLAQIAPVLAGSQRPLTPMPHVGNTISACGFFLASSAKGDKVPPLPTGYKRKGKSLMFQFDFDAVEMLYESAPTKKAIGRYLSELVRRDYVRRQEWQREQALAPPDLAEVGADE